MVREVGEWHDVQDGRQPRLKKEGEPGPGVSVRSQAWSLGDGLGAQRLRTSDPRPAAAGKWRARVVLRAFFGTGGLVFGLWASSETASDPAVHAWWPLRASAGQPWLAVQADRAWALGGGAAGADLRPSSLAVEVHHRLLHTEAGQAEAAEGQWRIWLMDVWVPLLDAPVCNGWPAAAEDAGAVVVDGPGLAAVGGVAAAAARFGIEEEAVGDPAVEGSAAVSKGAVVGHIEGQADQAVGSAPAVAADIEAAVGEVVDIEAVESLAVAAAVAARRHIERCLVDWPAAAAERNEAVGESAWCEPGDAAESAMKKINIKRRKLRNLNLIIFCSCLSFQIRTESNMFTKKNDDLHAPC